jgi:RimJ/RimL family protein N-acetyltransferase
MKDVLTLSTERDGLILRQLATRADDVAYLEAIDEDREHLSKLGNVIAEKYKTVADITHARTKAIDEGVIWMGIWDKDEFKGEISAHPKEEGTAAELGYWLKVSATGNGYATLAVKTLTSYLMLRFKKVFAEVHIKNAPSIRVMERAGYANSGIVDREWGKAIVFEALIL